MYFNLTSLHLNCLNSNSNPNWNTGTLHLRHILNSILNSAQNTTSLLNIPSGKEQEAKDSALNP